MKADSFLSKIEYPNEHGAWVLLFQTSFVGLVLAFSAAACLFVLAFLLLFLGSRSLRIMVAARAEKRETPRSRVAQKAVVLFGTLSFLAATAFAAMTSWDAWVPLLLVSPAGIILFRANSTRRDRDLIPELAATVFITVPLPVLLLAGGYASQHSYALWIAWLAHTLLAVLYVRARFRRERGKKANVRGVFAFCCASWLLLLVLFYGELLSFLVLGGFGVLTGRLFAGLLISRAPTPPKVLGWQETFWGTFFALCLIVGF